MTIQQLTYFLATVEHGSFSGAARSLYLTQPSISEQVRQLEGELGIALFARAGRGLVLTEAGRRFRPEAERVLAGVERARDAVAEVRDLRGGTLGFGMFGTASAYLIADLAADFRRKYPDVRLRLVGLNSSEVADQVRSRDPGGRVSSFFPSTTPGSTSEWRGSRSSSSSAERPDAPASPVTIEALAEAPLILYDAQYGAHDPMRRQLVDRAQRAGVIAAARGRGRGNRGRRRSRAQGPRRHDRAAGGDQPSGCPWPPFRIVRRAALRHVRLHRALGRPAVARGAGIRRDRRAPTRARIGSSPVRGGHVRDGSVTSPPC